MGEEFGGLRPPSTTGIKLFPHYNNVTTLCIFNATGTESSSGKHALNQDSLKPVVLKGGRFCPSRDIWQYLEESLVVTTGGGATSI